MPDALEHKDVTSASGGSFTLPAFGSAALTSRSPSIIATPVENALRNMAKVHNAVHTEPAQRADVTALRAVYRRGAKTYSRSRHPASSRRKWAMQRVKNHLHLLANGSRPHPRYVQDDDLLPAGHPLAASSSGERKALLVVEGRHAELGTGAPLSVPLAAFLLEGKGFPEAISALEIKGRWDPNKHPRDRMGRFIHIGAAVDAVIGGKHQSATVLGINRGQVRVRTADGTEATIKAGDAEVTDHVGPHMSVMEHARAHTDADNKARQLAKDQHPEAAAFSQRRDALGERLKARVQAGESIHDPYRPAAAGDTDLSTAAGLHAHLTGSEHGNADVPEFGQDEHAAYSEMHDRAHQLGADHTHTAADAATHAAVGDESGADRPGDAPERPDGSAWGSGYSPGDPRNDPNYDRYVANLDAQIDAALKDVGDTSEVHDHVDGVDGAYQPERQAQHDAILDDLMENYRQMPRERKAVMLAGPSGAGKSTTIKQLGHEFGVEADDQGNPTNYATVNPDDIKDIMVKRGMVDPALYSRFGLGPNESAALIHEESSHIAKRLHRQLVSHGTNVLVDGTFSGRLDKNVGKINSLRSEGYTVTGVLVDGDIDRSLTNAGKRHRGDSRGPAVVPDYTIGGARLQGRYVPLGHIEAQRPLGYYSDLMDRPHRSNNAENFEQAKEAFNGGIRVYDNSSGAAKLIYSDEPAVGATKPEEGLDNATLERVKNGTTGTVRSSDLPGIIAQGLTRAAREDRPQIIQAGYYGYGIAHAPVGFNSYFEVSPGGHVAEVSRDTRTGVVTRKPMPVSDVQKIVGHYVKDTHTQLPRTRRRNPLPNGERVIHQDGRRGHVEHVTVSQLRAGDDLIHPVTGAPQGKVSDIRVGNNFEQSATDKTPLGADRQVHIDGEFAGVKAPGARFTRFQPEAAGPDGGDVQPARGISTGPSTAADLKPNDIIDDPSGMGRMRVEAVRPGQGGLLAVDHVLESGQRGTTYLQPGQQVTPHHPGSFDFSESGPVTPEEAQRAVEVLGDDKAKEILGDRIDALDEGLPGATPEQLRALVDAARAAGLDRSGHRKAGGGSPRR